MPIIKIVCAVLVLHLSLPAMADSLSGFTYMSPKGKNAYWKALPVKICPAPLLPIEIKGSLHEAAKVWNQTFGKEIFNTDCLAPTSKYIEGDGATHGVYWITSGFEKFTDKTSLARTMVDFDDAGEIIDSDILLNGEYYDWHGLPIDAQTIFVHELGHVLGLKHFFLSLDSAMNYFPYVSGYQHREIGEYEKIVISNLYLKKEIKAPEYLKYFFSGDTDKATRTLEAQKNITVESLYALAYLYKAQKKFNLAKLSLKKILEAQPKYPGIHQLLGDAQWSLNDEAGAEKEFLLSLEADPKNYETMANLGSIYLHKGDQKKSVEYFKKSLAIQPAHWLACGILFEQTKEEKYQACRLKYGPK